MLTLQMPAAMENLHHFQKAISQEAETACFSAEGLLRLDLVLEELLVNIFNHAYGTEGGTVAVHANADAGAMHICIKDTGLPFNLLEAEEADISAGIDDREIGGLGILLIRQMTESLSYQRTENENILNIIVADPHQ